MQRREVVDGGLKVANDNAATQRDVVFQWQIAKVEVFVLPQPTSFVKVASEKKDKQRWHRAWRARQRAVLNAAVRITEAKDIEEAFAGFNLILPREVSDVWAMEKDGKVRYSPVKYRDENWWKKVMHK